MKKKLVFIGVGLLITALVLFLVSGYILSNGFSKNVNVENLKVSPDNFTYVMINYNSTTSALAIYSIFNNATNLYIFNSTMFSKWYSYMSQNRSTADGYDYALKVGGGNRTVYRNATVEIVPIDLTGSTAKNFSGKIYAVVDNTKGSKSSGILVNASVSFVPLSSSVILISAGLGYGVLILGVAAIILIIYGIIKKDPIPKSTPGKSSATTEDQKKYLDQLYKGVKTKKEKKNKDTDTSK